MIEIYPEELNKTVAQMSAVKNMKFKFNIEDNVLYWVEVIDVLDYIEKYKYKLEVYVF